MPVHLFFLHLASLCVFYSLNILVTYVLSCSAWPVLRGDLAALCLVSQLSVWSRGALLRRLSQCRCASVNSFVFLRESCISVPMFHYLSARSIEEHFVSPSLTLTLLLVGRTGWLHLQRRQNHLPAPPARTAPLRPSPSLPSRGLLARVS